ncbi:MAG: glycosyltransferase [Planctomycetota bacterium]|nr:glycosyltransferase [Planctomycetota bacterium]
MSVLIPTHRRAAKLGACVGALARQHTDARFEVLVGVDGGDEGASARAAHDAWGDRPGLRVVDLPKGGPGAVRNALARLAAGALTILLNDDVVPEPTLLDAHVAARRTLADPRALVLGDAPWKRHTPDRLFDQVVRETSMVFFYDRMLPHWNDRDRDWGYRHAWTLNLSLPTDLLRETRFFEIDGTYGYDDIEFAYRARVPVFFRPGARVVHDHRIEPAEYLRREYHLGRTARVYAARFPEMCRDLFRRDILSPVEVDAARRHVHEGLTGLRRVCLWFLALADTPAGQMHDNITALYDAHLPLKRWAWRRGLLDALDDVAARDIVRELVGEPVTTD